MLDDVKGIARAIATVNRHPTPEAYAEQVATVYAEQNPTILSTVGGAPTPAAAPTVTATTAT